MKCKYPIDFCPFCHASLIPLARHSNEQSLICRNCVKHKMNNYTIRVKTLIDGEAAPVFCEFYIGNYYVLNRVDLTASSTEIMDDILFDVLIHVPIIDWNFSDIDSIWDRIQLLLTFR